MQRFAMWILLPVTMLGCAGAGSGSRDVATSLELRFDLGNLWDGSVLAAVARRACAVVEQGGARSGADPAERRDARVTRLAADLLHTALRRHRVGCTKLPLQRRRDVVRRILAGAGEVYDLARSLPRRTTHAALYCVLVEQLPTLRSSLTAFYAAEALAMSNAAEESLRPRLADNARNLFSGELVFRWLHANPDLRGKSAEVVQQHWDAFLRRESERVLGTWSGMPFAHRVFVLTSLERLLERFAATRSSRRDALAERGISTEDLRDIEAANAATVAIADAMLVRMLQACGEPRELDRRSSRHRLLRECALLLDRYEIDCEADRRWRALRRGALAELFGGDAVQLASDELFARTPRALTGSSPQHDAALVLFEDRRRFLEQARRSASRAVAALAAVMMDPDRSDVLTWRGRRSRRLER